MSSTCNKLKSILLSEKEIDFNKDSDNTKLFYALNVSTYTSD